MNLPLTLNLPWPPSVNHYWGQKGKRRFVTPKGVAYHWEVINALNEYRNAYGFRTLTKDKKLRLSILATPPDNRKRDIDNIVKCIADSLQNAGVYEDDYQIDQLLVSRCHGVQGRVIVEVTCL